MWNLVIFLFVTSSDRHLDQKHKHTKIYTQQNVNKITSIYIYYQYHTHMPKT